MCPPGGLPAVFGEFHAGDGFPTVAIYNHMDVQPASPDGWKSADPFVMEIDADGNYFGRGTTDDKGPALAALYGASMAHAAGVDVNVQFFWEMEEEIGSPNFPTFLETLPTERRPDAVAVSDTIWVDSERPAMPYGLRGMLTFFLRLETGAGGATHSGLVGGLARNPFAELCTLLSECADGRTGEILIPGVTDSVRPLSPDEAEGFVASGWSAAAFCKAHKQKSLRTDDPAEATQRIWARPTFEIHGITGGYTGPGILTAVPPRAEAKVSMRLVPDQDPHMVLDCVRRFVAERNPDVELISEATLRPFLGPRTGPIADAAADAVEAAFGRRPALVREGGSIGAVVQMEEHFGVPIVMMGLSLPEHHYHGVDENFSWHQASRGIEMFREFLSRVGP